MTASCASATRVVTIARADHPGWWPPGYWDGLVGLDLRIPALIEHGRVLAGYLRAVRETEDTIELTFGGLEPED